MALDLHKLLLCAFLLAVPVSGCCEGEGLVSDYLHLAGPAAAQDIIAEITASVPGPPFMVGTAVNFTCNAVNTTTNTDSASYLWVEMSLLFSHWFYAHDN